MSNQTPARDFILPRLQTLIADAGSIGVSRDVAVAVLIDLVTGPGFNDTPLDPADDTEAARTDALATELDEAVQTEQIDRRAFPSRRGVIDTAGRLNLPNGHGELSDI